MSLPASLVFGEIDVMTELRSVRQSLALQLTQLHLGDRAVDDAMVMVTELVANAVEHGGRRATVSMDWTDDEVRVSVFDTSSTLPAVPDLDPTRPGGRGLRIVEAFADRHGFHPEPGGGKTIWFALDRTR